jgi:hypothetical protein
VPHWPVSLNTVSSTSWAERAIFVTLGQAAPSSVFFLHIDWHLKAAKEMIWRDFGLGAAR